MNRAALTLVFEEASPSRSVLFEAIPRRQCSRAEYDGTELSPEELRLLEEARARLRSLRDDAHRGPRRMTSRTGSRRCYERLALRATALDLRTAFINQPVEVPALRPEIDSPCA